VSRGPASRLASDPAVTQEDHAPSRILSQDWSLEYENDLAFTEEWTAITTGWGDWPSGFKLFSRKLYFRVKLCVPTTLVPDVLRVHHEWVGHVGNDRLLPEVC
jgi:hypothetical protein